MECVLILIVVDNGLVHLTDWYHIKGDTCLNPYCSGQWSRTWGCVPFSVGRKGLNPYCSGHWSRTPPSKHGCSCRYGSLNPYCSGQWSRTVLYPEGTDVTELS